MSAKCKYCKDPIYDEDGQCYGTQLQTGEWVCDDELCNTKADHAALREAAREMKNALERIKSESEMWQAAAQSTAATRAIPPWWNLGDIAAATLKKFAALLNESETES